MALYLVVVYSMIQFGQQSGFGIVLYKLWMLVEFITAAMDVICLTIVLVGTRLHWSIDSLPVFLVGEKEWPVLLAGDAVLPVK